MSLDLTIRGEQIIAGGHDFVGDFSMEGSYDPSTDAVVLVKRYRWHSVRYEGRWDGALVFGTWEIEDGDFQASGEFEMWPDDEATSLEEFVQSGVEKRELVIVGRPTR